MRVFFYIGLFCIVHIFGSALNDHDLEIQKNCIMQYFFFHLSNFVEWLFPWLFAMSIFLVCLKESYYSDHVE